MTHYNPEKQIYVASDERSFGLGVVIPLKDGKTNQSNMHQGRYYWQKCSIRR